MSTTETRPAIDEVAALAGEHAGQADADRRLAPEVVQALVDAGFARWFVPKRWGGSGGGFADLTAAVASIGEQCGSTAWIASLLAYSGRYLACLPEQGQAEVWADGPDVRVPAVVKPLGSVTPVDGGFLLSGSYTYVSGVEFSDWTMVTGPAPGPASGGQPLRFFVIPRSEYTYQDTWFSLGMRATGSHTLVLDDVFVPEHRTFLREDAMRGITNAEPGRPPLPTLAVNGLTFVAPVLGAARGAFALASRAVAKAPTGPRAASGQAYQVDVARAGAEIDAAGLLIERIAATADSGKITPELVRRGRRDAAFALETLTHAVDRLFRVGGTQAQDIGHPLQRAWRDVRSVASHAVVQFEPAAIDYTQGLNA